MTTPRTRRTYGARTRRRRSLPYLLVTAGVAGVCAGVTTLLLALLGDGTAASLVAALPVVDARAVATGVGLFLGGGVLALLGGALALVDQ